MRIVLITYDFPPEQSPRSLRWRFLVRELLLLGHDVHVLCPDLGDVGVSFPNDAGTLVLHRSFPGPYGWLVRRSRGKKRQPQAGSNGRVEQGDTRSASLNWRGRAVGVLKTVCGWMMYPDIRAEWLPWGYPDLRRVLREVSPDVVITSHEPALTLRMGRWAQRKGFRWVADLGDPVCANYTPHRWRRRARRLERMVSRCADRVIVTTEATRCLLRERHGMAADRCLILTNGYDDRRDGADAGHSVLEFDPDKLELIHSGRLYAYRDPTRLLRVVDAMDGVRLTLVLPDPPVDTLASLLRHLGDQVRVVGPLTHGEVMAAARAADVLVNWGNVGQSVQVPAKMYEYLGIRRPILHVVTGRIEVDTVAQLLQPMSRGWVCEDTDDALRERLEDLIRRKRERRLHDGLRLEPLGEYAHTVLGRRLEHCLKAVIATKSCKNPETQ